MLSSRNMRIGGICLRWTLSVGAGLVFLAALELGARSPRSLSVDSPLLEISLLRMDGIPAVPAAHESSPAAQPAKPLPPPRSGKALKATGKPEMAVARHLPEESAELPLRAGLAAVVVPLSMAAALINSIDPPRPAEPKPAAEAVAADQPTAVQSAAVQYSGDQIPAPPPSPTEISTKISTGIGTETGTETGTEISSEAGRAPPLAEPRERSARVASGNGSGRAPLVSAQDLDPGFALRAGGRPRYPARARRLGRSGTVRMEILVNTDGSVARVKVREESQGWGFGAAAREAFSRARFTPPTVTGTPVRVLWRKTLRFQP